MNRRWTGDGNDNSFKSNKKYAMKFNWGTGIALFYGTFVVVLVFAVIQSTKQDNSLVSDDYYADDLKYQEHYDKLVNAQSLEQDLTVKNNANQGQVELQFPSTLGQVTGEVYFFCPSDSQQDFRVPVETDTAFLQVVSTQNLKQGLWKVKVDWKAQEKVFFKEQVITLL